MTAAMTTTLTSSTRGIEMGIDLPLIWAVIIIFGIMMYVVMDGFDLGIGILFPFIPGKVDRDVMMNTVAPVWDGNETWLVLGGAALFGAFPLAYSVVLSALYLPLILMLIGLIFRGVAFEFRFKAKDDKRHLWDKAFIGGSIAATFFQGVALGAFIDGIPVVRSAFGDLHLAKKPGLDDAKWFKLADILELNFYNDILPIVTKAVTILSSEEQK